MFSFGFSPYIIDVFCSLHFCSCRENKVTLRSVAFVIKMSVCATFSSDFGVGNFIVQHKTESTNCFNASRSVIRNPLHQKCRLVFTFPCNLSSYSTLLLSLCRPIKGMRVCPPPPPVTWSAITELIYIGHIVSFWFATVNMPSSAHLHKQKNYKISF